MRFWLGLVIGMIAGSGGTYLALERPWAASEDAEVEALDAGAAVAKEQGGKRKRGSRGRRGRGGGETGGEAGNEVEIPVLSEAERNLVWRGDAVELPPKQVDFASGSDGRPLDSNEINQVIRGQSEGLIECIAQARGNAELTAQITIKMLVDVNGKVVKLRARAPLYLFEHGFYACANQAARAMRFPATGAPTVVEVPYDLD